MLPSRSDALKMLLLLVAWDGILSACIHNTATEMIEGKFYQKFKDTAHQLKNLESSTNWSSVIKGEKSVRTKKESYLIQCLIFVMGRNQHSVNQCHWKPNMLQLLLHHSSPQVSECFGNKQPHLSPTQSHTLHS